MGLYALHKAQEKMLVDIVRTVLGGGRATRNSVLDKFPKSNYRSTYWRRAKSFEELEKEGFITVSGEIIKITKKGLDAVKQGIFLESASDRKNEKWDGTWHFVAYDIPEKNKKDRNYFQRKIKEAGLFQIQDSLWVYPYECEEEIGLMANDLGLNNYVAFMKTSRVPFDKDVRRHFNLHYRR